MSLLEALISLVFMVAVGMGLAYVTSRALVAQRYMNAQHLAVSQMRYELQSGCSNTASTSVVTSNCALTSNTITASMVTSVSGTLSTSVAVNYVSNSASSTLVGGKVTINP